MDREKTSDTLRRMVERLRSSGGSLRRFMRERVRPGLAETAHRLSVYRRYARRRMRPVVVGLVHRSRRAALEVRGRTRRIVAHVARRARPITRRLRRRLRVLPRRVQRRLAPAVAGAVRRARVTARYLRGRLRPIPAAAVRGLRTLARRAALGARSVAVGAGRRLRALVVVVMHRPRYLVAPLVVGVVAGLGLFANCGLDGCPDVRRLTAYQPGGAPVLLDRHGERFADLAPYERVIVSLDSLPAYAPDAFLAVEDRRFWHHRGVDWHRVPSAALANLRARTVTEGSSTIPMQLARNVFPRELPGSERTFKRKLQEARVAQLIERTYEKREILEMYLNHIYFGGGAYGIEAATRLYFGKPASELTLAEAATLAALPKAPSHYDPRREPERSLARRDLILTLMERQGLVPFRDAETARGIELAVQADGARDRSGVPLGPNFIDIVRDDLEARFGEGLYRSRLRIHTTLDPVAQRAAETELESQLASLSGRVRAGDGPLQGAVVIMETATGDVLAMVGSGDPTLSRYNRATHGRRQVGSAFKPFVFATALAEGVPTSQVVPDTPLRMQLSRHDVWEPSNYDGRFEGQVTFRSALVRSRNVPTIRLAATVGIDDVARTARTVGVRAPMDETPALALGTVAMSPLQLTMAYIPFATLGRTAEPRFVVRVEDEESRVLWEEAARPSQEVLDPAVAYIITDILRDAVNHGTGTGVRTAGFQGVVAGKTGTTNDATDVWFVGYTPDLVATVWIGYDRPSPLGGRATGGGFAAPVWGRIMRQVYAERPPAPEWPRPASVVARRIDPWTGLVLREGCHPRYGGATTEIFLARYVPETVCPYRGFWTDLWTRMSGHDAPSRGRPPRGRPPGRH